MNITAYVIFVLAGLAFGYAAPGKAKLLPLLFPLALALGAIAQDGVDGTVLARLVIALAVTLAGVAIGRLLEERTAGGKAAGAT
jgi:hypothetical protein